jgi:hypothetical protein
MAKPTGYVETTVLSVLTSRPARDIVQMALQQLTSEWWDAASGRFELFSSDFVLREASRGDREAAGKRMEIAEGLAELAVTPAVAALAKRSLKETGLPSKAQLDAAHLACAAVHRMDFLVTWNCTHIANAVLMPQMQATCRTAGHKYPQICTPQELMTTT